MYQAGVKNITLYENKNLSFWFWNPLDLYQITEIINEGEVIQFENLQRPEFDISFENMDGGDLGQIFNVKFLLFGLLSENYETLNLLKYSIYGFCFLVEYYDGTFKFYNTPIKFKDSKINPHEEMTFELTFNNRVPTKERFYEYTAGVPTTGVYRWDSEVLTFDSEIYTFDYEL